MRRTDAPESVDDSQDGEAGCDDDEALVLRGRPLRRDVLVLAPERKSKERGKTQCTNRPLQGHRTGCRTGNGEKLSGSQAEPGRAIKSAVA